MREIKFRALCDGELIYQSDTHSFNIGGPHGDECLAWLGFDLIGSKKIDKLEQYTGLKDINGKEICEGDVLSVDWLYQANDKPYISDSTGIKFIVNWSQGKFIASGGTSSFDLSEINQATFERFWREDYNSAKPEYFKMVNIKVIGNIHENPELLEEL